MSKQKADKAVKALQQRKKQLLRSMYIPSDGLPGSLSPSRYRCGKAGCHCRKTRGHEKWALTYMQEGKKRVKHIPTELVEYVRKQVELSKSFKEQLNEIFGLNTELLILLRKTKPGE
jgi:hypothetical protein